MTATDTNILRGLAMAGNKRSGSHFYEVIYDRYGEYKSTSDRECVVIADTGIGRASLSCTRFQGYVLMVHGHNEAGWFLVNRTHLCLRSEPYDLVFDYAIHYLYKLANGALINRDANPQIGVLKERAYTFGDLYCKSLEAAGDLDTAAVVLNKYVLLPLLEVGAYRQAFYRGKDALGWPMSEATKAEIRASMNEESRLASA